MARSRASVVEDVAVSDTDPVVTPAHTDPPVLAPDTAASLPSIVGAPRFPVAAAGSIGAGMVSAVLGVGGGIIKVPVMHLVLGVPLRVATATSNLMIGITASTSAIVYLLRGGIDAHAAGPTAVGVFVGATLGSRLGHRVDVRLLRMTFVAVLLFTAIEMARRALGAT